MTRTTFATAILLLASFNIGFADETSDKLAECAAIQSDAERVACYDAIASGRVVEEVAPAAAVVEPTTEAAAPEVVESTVEPTAEASAAPAEEPTVETTVEATAAPTEETFGQPADDLNREAGVPAGSDTVDRLVATITGVRLYRVDRVIITLDNGQEWRQTSASRKKFTVGDKIEINKGAVGSYRMTELDGSHAMKVRRVD
jgi:hypothetical protein